MSEKTEKKPHLTAIVNLGHAPRGHALFVNEGRQQRKFHVPQFCVLLADERFHPLLQAGRMSAQDRRLRGEDRFHPWDYLRWWDLGLDIADESTLHLPKVDDEKAALEARKNASIDIEKFSRYFTPADPVHEWAPAWVPTGVATVTQAQATVWMNNYSFRAEDMVSTYGVFLLNEKGKGNLDKRGRPRPYVQNPEAIKVWLKEKLEKMEAAVQRGTGIKKAKNPLLAHLGR